MKIYNGRSSSAAAGKRQVIFMEKGMVSRASPWLRRRRISQGVMLAATAAMGIGLYAYMLTGSAAPGTALEVSEADAAAYGITEAYRLEDGSYYIVGSAYGFKSDVATGVTLTADGTVQAIEIVSQDETENLGGQCVNPEFTGQFAGVAAPVTLNGKSYTVTDPSTGEAYSSAADEEAAPAELFDPDSWREGDNSPEANAMRAMYSVELTRSSKAGTAMAEQLPADDTSPEGRARTALYNAGLTQSAKENREQEIPFVDLAPEAQAVIKLGQVGLVVKKAEAAQNTAQLTGVDAVSGATLTSGAVATAVNSAYFYTQNVLAQ